MKLPSTVKELNKAVDHDFAERYAQSLDARKQILGSEVTAEALLVALMLDAATGSAMHGATEADFLVLASLAWERVQGRDADSN